MRLLVAWLLIRFIPFGRWRGSMGKLCPQNHAGPEGFSVTGEDHYLARVVERAALRLPLEMKCLPRAMALHWILRRRGRPSTLLIGVRPGAVRGGLDDLHAWVDLGRQTLIGASAETYRVLARFEF